MKQLKLITLFCIGALCTASNSFGQANPFINVLPSNGGIVAVGDTIDIVVTIGNTGPISTIAQAKLRPIIQVPPSVTFLPTAAQVGLPAGWTILTNSGSQLRVCNSTDPIPVNTSRSIVLKVKGVSVSAPQTFSGNINFGNGTTCAAGVSVAGDLTTDNSATSTIKVESPLVTLNLKLFIQGYWDGVSLMKAVLANQGETSTINACDSIDVELHSNVAPFGLDYATRTILEQNGTATCTFPPSSGSKYIVVKHRSALQTWSANPVTMGANVNYDFSTDASKAYGDNQVQISTSPNIWALYSGDVIIDENMDLLDLGAVESDISNFTYGYVSTDLNGDGNVDLLDSPMLESNISNFIYSVHP
jgi:hypothetical protein